MYDWVLDIVFDEGWSNDPGKMTVEDAAYNLKCYAEEEREIPEGITPETFCAMWNKASAVWHKRNNIN